ncbi:TrbC/VirB2 family protein [Aurantiacibacter luteus]|uniref:TrbC/VirB2 family protein n=1 Tax=Aurantiacibacter luteus TaxID=1581420 RepID=UPI0007B06F00|nr:TrbC/VirB2 family protein [Aurantiacibacter luteus]
MFETTANAQPIAAAMGWIVDVLLGEVAATLCVIAIAFVGYSMLTGRLAIRRGAQVVLGCFVLLGAPAIAAGMVGLWEPEGRAARSAVVVYEARPRGELVPSGYSPYLAPEPVPAPQETGTPP